MAAQLRLSGTKSSPEDRQQAVDDLIQRLGLSASADTIVGNAKTRFALTLGLSPALCHASWQLLDHLLMASLLHILQGSIRE